MDVVDVTDGVVANISKEQFSGLVAAANSGDPLALAELRRTLASNPSISAKLGDVAGMVEKSLCREFIKHDVAMAEIIAGKANQLRQSLIAGSKSPIVHLAVDRAIISWLTTNLFDLKYGDVSAVAAAEASAIVKQKLAAERRHLAALRTLGQVRALVENPAKNSTRRSGQPLDEDSPLSVMG